MSQETVDQFILHEPDLETMIRGLQTNNPTLLYFLLRRSEQLSDGILPDKEKYARIAVEMLGMLALENERTESQTPGNLE